MSNKWITDASQINLSRISKLTFRNDKIDGFIHTNRDQFISAGKGMGKTLLLTYKRKILAEKFEGEGVVFIPQNEPFLDTLDEFPNVSHKLFDLLKDHNLVKRLWSACLKVSILTYFKVPYEGLNNRSIPENIWNVIKKSSMMPPTEILHLLIRLTPSRLADFINNARNDIEYMFRQVDRSIMIFIDKVDQGIPEASKSAWVTLQAGLIEAAWDLSIRKPKIKIFCTIRQEAYSNYLSPIKLNVHGNVFFLKYESEELKYILDRLAYEYEKKKSFKEFLNLDIIEHGEPNKNEDSFDFIHRHTLGRPRDFVLLAQHLSNLEENIDQGTLVKEINEICEKFVVPPVFKEVDIFLSCLSDEFRRRKFFALTPCNVLDYKMVHEIYNNFNVSEIIGENERFHPFSELYNAGLLGILKRTDNGNGIQVFKQPSDILNYDKTDMPDSDYYFVHPSLTHLMEGADPNNFTMINEIIIGHNYEWKTINKLFVDIILTELRASDDKIKDVLQKTRIDLKSKKRNQIVELLKSAHHNIWEISTDKDISILKSLQVITEDVQNSSMD